MELFGHFRQLYLNSLTGLIKVTNLFHFPQSRYLQFYFQLDKCRPSLLSWNKISTHAGSKLKRKIVIYVGNQPKFLNSMSLDKDNNTKTGKKNIELKLCLEDFQYRKLPTRYRIVNVYQHKSNICIYAASTSSKYMKLLAKTHNKV